MDRFRFTLVAGIKNAGPFTNESLAIPANKISSGLRRNKRLKLSVV